MGTIAVPNTFSANTTISSSQVNANFTTIYNEFNGSIAAANLASDSVTTAKIADSNVTTTKINDSAVTSAKINADAVTATKIDWASTGVDGGIWGEELGRTTLGSSGDTITVAIAARKYLTIEVLCLSTGGTTLPGIRFNTDTGSNYTIRNSTNGGADASSGSASNIQLCTATAGNKYLTARIVNVATQEKMVHGMVVSNNAAGAANVADKWEGTGKWVNTSDQITSITIFNSGTGDFATGSELVVLGHN